MRDSKKFIVIALGGSIIVPREGAINVEFLKKFRRLILKFIKKNYKFIIIAGGGKISRIYQKAASKIVRLPYEDMDWLGIHATRLNAHLLRTIFRDKACPTVFDNPYKQTKVRQPIIIASGWKPGWSTDYDAVLLAKRFGAREIIDAGNIPFVYTRDPKIARKNGPKSRPIKKISWKNYQKLIGSRWIPGLPAPIDPIAAEAAKKFGIKAVIVLGTDLGNLEGLILGKKFRGTTIE